MVGGEASGFLRPEIEVEQRDFWMLLGATSWLIKDGVEICLGGLAIVIDASLLVV